VRGLGSGGIVALGGTPAPGLALAVAFGGLSVRNDFDGSPIEPDGDATANLAQLGLLADWFPDPNGGWHVGGMAGVAGVGLADSAIADSIGGAFTGALLGGYDWWIGPQWTLGLMGLVSATTSASLQDEDGADTGYEFNALFAGIAYAFTLH
jgi:hypothetical protein